MWWRRSWFSLNGKVGFRGSGAGRTSYATQPPPPTSRSVQQGYFGAHSSALSVTERVNLRGTEVFASCILGLIVPCRALRSADAEALPRIGHGRSRRLPSGPPAWAESERTEHELSGRRET